MNRLTFGIVVAVLFVAGLVYFIYQENDIDFDEANKSYEVVKKWDLPNALDEISGMVWLGDNKIACIQDEDGIIFIYDLKASKIVKEVKFGGPGDYEALTMLNKIFYIAESDGKLFKLEDLDDMNSKAEKIELDFEYKNNIEGIAATADGNLLIAPKDRNLEKDKENFRALYTYNPETKELLVEPAYKIRYTDPAFKKVRSNNPRKLMRPSDITFHPQTGELYILDAEFPKLVIVGKNSRIKKLHLLNPEEFFQPEGICFTPSGRMFISNEGKGGDPNILEVKLK